jgi:hypothetical protein
MKTYCLNWICLQCIYARIERAKSTLVVLYAKLESGYNAGEFLATAFGVASTGNKGEAIATATFLASATFSATLRKTGQPLFWLARV